MTARRVATASLRGVLAPDPDDLDRLLDDLEPAQREAVLATSGPVVILAAAGTGKTRVISRRTAYAVLTGISRSARLRNQKASA